MNLAIQSDLLANHKLHARTVFQGLPISVENRAGSTRRGVDPGGKPWATKMVYPYGYLRRTEGVDGDHIDCFIGPHKNAANAYIIDINKPPDFKAFDEQKVMLGFNSLGDAKRAFMLHYDNPKFFGKITAVPMTDFKKKALGTFSNPTKLAAATALDRTIALHCWGQGAQIGIAHIEPMPTVHPPSLRNPQRIPVDAPWETDDRFGDVSRRRKAEKFRYELMRHHGPGQREVSVRTTSIGWQPVAVTVGV